MNDDTTPPCVRDVLGTPGRYRFDGLEFYWFFEVDTAGVVHQLKPATLQRDGVLRPDRWTPDAVNGRVTRVWES